MGIEMTDKTLIRCKKQSWEAFRETGLVVFVNQFLHIFGWAIAFGMDHEGNIHEVFPMRTRFRGFTHEDQAEAYKKVSVFMKNNAETLLEETND
jgi:hypothetical protein